MAMARTPRMTGAFHGAMPTQTPAGWRTPIAKRARHGRTGMVSPVICVVIAAASSRMVAAKPVLKWPQPPMAPVSSTHRREKSALWARSFAAASISSLRRALGPSADQAGKALAAASQAARASSADAAAERVTTSPVIGLLRSKVAPLFAADVGAADQQFDVVHGCFPDAV